MLLEDTKYRLWDRVKISQEFFDLLRAVPLFQKDPKAINTAFYWLNGIQAAVINNDGEPVTWDWRDIYDRFRPYGESYTLFRDALRDAGLFNYSKYTSPKRLSHQQGECRKFQVTPFGQRLLLQANKEYLYKLCHDPDVRRNNQKNISKRKVMSKTYSDPLLNHLNDVQTHLTFDLATVNAQLNTETNVHRYDSVVRSLTSIQTKTFKELTYNVIDGRIPNVVTNFPKDYKTHLVYRNEYRYSAMLDMRACWPTFLAEMIYNIYSELLKDSRDPHSPSPNKLKEYLAACKVVRSVNLLAIGTECEQWNKLFTYSATDPREVIARKVGVKVEVMKPLLNQWLNGKRKSSKRDGFTKYHIRELEQWFRKEFPELHKVWSLIEREATGCLISEFFESPLFRDTRIYDFAKTELDLILNDENDGYGIRSRCSKEELPAKLNQLSDYVLKLGKEKLGLTIPLKLKLV